MDYKKINLNQKPKEKSLIRQINKIVGCIFVVLLIVIIFLSIYISREFYDVSLEQLIYSIKNSDGTSTSVLINGALYVLKYVALCLFVIISFLIIFDKIKTDFLLKIKFKNKEYVFNLLRITKKKRVIFVILLFIFSISFSCKCLKINDYIKNKTSYSNLFEKSYVKPETVSINFPNQKQNLIYIYVESLEMTNASASNGGGVPISYIPELEEMALENINFSNSNNLGGAFQLSGTTWTMAAMMAQTAAVSLKVNIDANEYYNMGESLPGVYNLGDILEENGYKNYLMLGSDATFGGRRDYFTYHGNYTIYDYVYAKESNWIDKDYHVWWGYEDSKLFEFAKKQLIEVANNNEPFNFTILTADTHFTDGYLDSTCDTPFDNKYANVFSCSPKMVNAFVEWIQEQEFYEDTTIIISGDHLTMQNDFYNEIIDDNYTRNVYNAFINSRATETNSKNRIFTTLDMFPTTIAALGATIDGDRLGLGTNLFSSKKTLAEELGFDYLNTEIQKNSSYYNNYILGDSYKVMKEMTSAEENNLSK